MPGSSTTPGRPGTRAHAPVRVAFRFRNGVGTRDMNLCEAQWLAYVLPYRRFAAALTGDRARLGADVDRYSVIASDLHRLLVAGLPAHCERFWTLPSRIVVLLQQPFGICDDPDYSTLKRSLTMNTYVAIIGGKAVLTFRGVDDDQADQPS